MKALLTFSLFISLPVFADAMKQMNLRLETYKEVTQAICDPTSSLSDDGLFVDVSCEFQCQRSGPRIERARGLFVPSQEGLKGGNGSSDQHTIWGSLGVGLKLWSQKICLEKASDSCKGAANVKTASIHELESGSWKIDHFPGCSEKKVMISPFSDNAGSNRVLHKVTALTSLGSNQFEEKNKNFKIAFPGLSMDIAPGAFNLDLKAPVFSKSTCKKIIKASLCFGDCIDMENSEGNLTETLATPNPLGKDEVEMCADALVQRLEKENLSPNVRKELCEAFFWHSMMNNEYRLYSSCAAIRGDVSCENF